MVERFLRTHPRCRYCVEHAWDAALLYLTGLLLVWLLLVWI